MAIRFLILSATFLVVTACKQDQAFHGMRIDPAISLPSIELKSASGTVTPGDEFMVLFFGYTHCPDVCPTTLDKLRKAKAMLGDEAGNLRIVMVSLDARRDTPEKVDSYVKNFDAGFIGVVGEEEGLQSLITKLGVFSAENGGRLDHTATTFVLNKKGQVSLLWSSDVTAEGMARDLQALLRI